MHLSRKLAVFAGFLMAGSLAGCQQSTEPAASESAATETVVDAAATSNAQSGLVASGGRLVLPVIAGRPGAAYFTVRNGTSEAIALANVDVAGAGKAEMHRTDGNTMAATDKVEIMPDGALEFAPGGLHVMVFDIDPKLKAGSSGEMTLTFSNGSKVAIPLDVEAMGGGEAGTGHDTGHDMSSMEGMQH